MTAPRPGDPGTWQEMLPDLLLLEAAGALGGIRAVVAARLAMTGTDAGPDAPLEHLSLDLAPGDNGRVGVAQLAGAGAWLAAAIDREEQEAPWAPLP